MKRIVTLILLLAVCLSLAACGKSDAVRFCEAQIEQLGTITLDDADSIQYARELYDNLSEKDRKRISNYETLTAAEAEYAKLANELETLRAAEPSAETLNALRQLHNGEAVNEAIAFVAIEMLKQQIRAEGYQDPEKSDTHLWNVDSFTFETDGESLEVFQTNSGPRTAIKSDFRLSRSETTMRFYATGCHFSRGEIFVYERTNVATVIWTTSLRNNTRKENIGDCGTKIDSLSEMQKWPYSQSKDALNESFAKITDADDFLEELNDTLRHIKMPFSAWELAGIYDPDAGNLPGQEVTPGTPEPEATEAPKMNHYPDTQIPTFDAFVDCAPEIEEEPTWTIYNYVHNFGAADTQTYRSYIQLKGEFYEAFDSYQKEMLSKLELKTYYSNPETKTGITCYVWFDGNGNALSCRKTMNNSSYTVAIYIMKEADAEAYVEYYFTS